MDVCPFKTLEAPNISEIQETSLNTYVFLRRSYISFLLTAIVYFRSGEEEVSVLLLSPLFFLMSCTETTGHLDGKPTPM